MTQIPQPGPLTEEEGNKAYDILVEHCGAQEGSGRQNFVQVQAMQFCREFRFQGALGFGGKLYRSRLGFRVGCYPEDDNPDRDKMIEAANEAFIEL